MFVCILRVVLIMTIALNFLFLAVLNEKIANLSKVLNIPVQEVNYITFFKDVASDLKDELEDQRNSIRESLRNKGIEERNKVLLRAKDER